MEELVGKKILSYLLEEDGTKLTFITDKGKIIYETYGDCCSETWFEEMNGDFTHGVVTKVEEKKFPEDMKIEATRQEDDELYGYTLTIHSEYGSDRFADIVYRNSSNGYYGGSCECVLDETKGAV